MSECACLLTCPCHLPVVRDQPPVSGLCRLCGASAFVRFRPLSVPLYVAPNGTNCMSSAWVCLDCAPPGVEVALVPPERWYVARPLDPIQGARWDSRRAADIPAERPIRNYHTRRCADCGTPIGKNSRRCNPHAYDERCGRTPRPITREAAAS